MAQEVEGSSPFSHPIFFCQNFGKKNNEAARLHFTARSATSLKRHSLFFTSSLKLRSALLVKSLHYIPLVKRSAALPVKLLPAGVRMVFLLKAHLAVLTI